MQSGSTKQRAAAFLRKLRKSLCERIVAGMEEEVNDKLIDPTDSDLIALGVVAGTMPAFVMSLVCPDRLIHLLGRVDLATS